MINTKEWMPRMMDWLFDSVIQQQQVAGGMDKSGGGNQKSHEANHKLDQLQMLHNHCLRAVLALVNAQGPDGMEAARGKCMDGVDCIHLWHWHH